jgi:aminomethyltransferase
MADEDAVRSAFHESEESRGGHFHADGGWFWTEGFDSDPGGTKGYWATREDVSVWNVSPLIKWKFEGPDAAKAVDRVGTNRVVDLKNGGVRYSLVVDEGGAMMDEGTIYRVDDNTLYFMINSEGDEFEDYFKKNTSGLDVTITNVSRQMPNISVQGPRSREVVSKLAPGADVAGLRYFNFLTEPVDFAGAKVMLTRTGYSGELGYEIFLMDPADAEKVYAAVLAENVQPIGTDAVLLYRAESGLVIIGVDYATEKDPKTNPYDIGVEHAIKFDHDFVGKEALQSAAANVKNRYVTLVLDGEGESGYGADVVKDGQVVGLAPSPAVSPKFGPITLAIVPAELAETGTEVEVEGRRAVVNPNPLYDHEKQRPRS